jgi:hypothetical protein
LVLFPETNLSISGIGGLVIPSRVVRSPTVTANLIYESLGTPVRFCDKILGAIILIAIKDLKAIKDLL